MNLQRGLLLFALAWFASPSCCAAEEPLCVGNETELRQALADASASSFYDEIRLLPGTYYTGGQLFSYTGTAHSLSISGGWFADHDPCDTQLPQADATILDGQNVTAILSISDPGIAPGSALSVSNLTLRNGATSTNGESAALALFGALEQDLRVQNVVFLSSHNTAVPPFTIFTNAVTLNGFGNVYFINNAVADCTSNYANLAIFTQYTTQTVYMHNNTLSLNGGGFPALLDSGGGTAYRLVNNALTGQIYFNSRAAADPIRVWVFSNLGQWNLNGGFGGIAVQADIGNNGAIDPNFSGPLDFRPAGNSPLVNRGLNSPIGGSSAVDLDGKPRVDLGIIDVGAFESTSERIFANGFG